MEDSMIDIGSPLLNHLGKGGLLSPWNSLPEATLYSYYRRRCQASPKLCNVAQTDLRGYFMMSRFLFFGEMKAIKWNTWNTFEHFIFIIPSVHMKRWHESKGHKKSRTCLILYNIMHVSENLPFICSYVGHHNYPILLQYTSWITNNAIFCMQHFTKWLIPIHQLVIVKNQPRANTGQHLKARGHPKPCSVCENSWPRSWKRTSPWRCSSNHATNMMKHIILQILLCLWSTMLNGSAHVYLQIWNMCSPLGLMQKKAPYCDGYGTTPPFENQRTVPPLGQYHLPWGSFRSKQTQLLVSSWPAWLLAFHGYLHAAISIHKLFELSTSQQGLKPPGWFQAKAPHSVPGPIFDPSSSDRPEWPGTPTPPRMWGVGTPTWYTVNNPTPQIPTIFWKTQKRTFGCFFCIFQRSD